MVFIFTFGAQYFHEFVEDVFKKFIGTLVSRWKKLRYKSIPQYPSILPSGFSHSHATR